ncbi:MAG: DUF3343 domain-containing protein [Ruminococcus sp.]|nr:DUF3343 domain-containing protein [Ruminococcus sp.]
MDNLIRLSSMTQAMRARDILKKHGIKSKVTRIQPSRDRGSCSYGLKIDNRLYEAVDILRNNNIKVSGRALGDLF